MKVSQDTKPNKPHPEPPDAQNREKKIFSANPRFVSKKLWLPREETPVREKSLSVATNSRFGKKMVKNFHV